MIAIAIDDEPMALEVVKAHASRVPFVDLVASFTDAFQALDFMKKMRLTCCSSISKCQTSMAWIFTMDSVANPW